VRVGIVSFTDVDYGLDLANALSEAGIEVTFYSSLSHTSRSVGDADRPIERLYEIGLLRREVKMHLTRLNRMRDPRMFSIMGSLAKAIRNDGMDVVHILIGGGELWTAVLAKLLRQIPVVSTIIIPEPNVGEFPPPKAVIWINWLIAQGSDVVIVNGKDHVTVMREKYNYPAERVYYIPLGPRSVFLKWTAGEVHEENGTILFLGRINRHKGLEYLVKAQPLISQQIPSIRIIIAGQGEDLNRCRDFIADPDRFEIHDGFVPGEMVSELFQKSSVVAVPYISAATSGILMTAYVFGKPVVATRVGSLSEYVRDGETGFLVDPEDEKQLADALTRILADNELRRRMGKNGAEWVRGELGWRNITAQTLAAYKKAIDLHNGH